MFDGLVIEQDTAAALNRLISDTSHAVALVGPHGVGKGAIAARIIEQAVGTSPHVLRFDGSAQALGIDVAREVARFLSLTVPGKQQIRRVVLIEHAEVLTQEAQNALLKSIEEPPSDCLILLTLPTTHSLLSTIHSRLQHIPIGMPTPEQLHEHFGGSQAAKKAIAMADGLPGLIADILGSEKTLPIDEAKQLLGQTQFERLTAVDALAKDKAGQASLLSALQIICKAGLASAMSANSRAKTERWYKSMQALDAANRQLAANTNAKLVFSSLMIQL